MRDWHVHPDGWIGGVFYVEVPKRTLDQGVPEAGGAIQFGPLPVGGGPFTGAKEQRTVAPKVGELLLLPSYVSHRTWPNVSEERRTCVAFDVAPAPEAPERGLIHGRP